jgi:FixJ family two-component response regulator
VLFSLQSTHAIIGWTRIILCLWMAKRLTEKPLIAIVDDDDVFRGALENLVRSLGWGARTFASAESYLRSSLMSETRCLIADVQMPNVGGLELCERLSALGFDIPVVFITAYPDDTLKQRALNAGAVAFLHKPLDLQGRRLAECVEEALRRKENQR